MKALNNLRKRIKDCQTSREFFSWSDTFDAINAIEAELAERYVALPLDADGEPIRIGDVMEWADEPGVSRIVSSIQLAYDGWWAYVDGTGRRPSKYRHYKPPTVEDVLLEFADEVRRCCDTADTIAEYAKRLRLAGEGE